MERNLPSHLLAPEEVTLMDQAEIAAYNRRAKSDYVLHPELGPSSYEGDIDTAQVILLLANPGFDDTSTLDDHRYRAAGWPIAGLHPDAPEGLRKWWSARLRPLIEEFGAQCVSRTVACLQLTPWASSKFDGDLRLPSREMHLRAAEACARRGAVMLVMRAEKLWLESEAVSTTGRRFRVNSWRSSYVSSGNLPAAGWQAVRAAFLDA